jgi:hypothetical protein
MNVQEIIDIVETSYDQSKNFTEHILEGLAKDGLITMGKKFVSLPK